MMLIRSLRGPPGRRSGGRHLRTGAKGKEWPLLVPRIGPTHMDQETIDYLRHKGVFDLPTPAVCEMIIRTYFYYVHPFFPVVDARSFLDMIENARNKLSIHLLWSMFLAAANACVAFTPSLPSLAS